MTGLGDGDSCNFKEMLKINWFSAQQLYSAEARKKSQDGEFPTVTPFISGKLNHLMMI